MVQVSLDEIFMYLSERWGQSITYGLNVKNGHIKRKLCESSKDLCFF
jgi:hypothetical protein